MPSVRCNWQCGPCTCTPAPSIQSSTRTHTHSRMHTRMYVHTLLTPHTCDLLDPWAFRMASCPLLYSHSDSVTPGHLLLAPPAPASTSAPVAWSNATARTSSWMPCRANRHTCSLGAEQKRTQSPRGAWLCALICLNTLTHASVAQGTQYRHSGCISISSSSSSGSVGWQAQAQVHVSAGGQASDGWPHQGRQRSCPGTRKLFQCCCMRAHLEADGLDRRQLVRMRH